MDLNIRDSVSVTIDGSNVTDKVLRYTRDQNICSGIATLQLTLVDDSTNYDPWDLIIISEGGHQAGRFYIVKSERNEVSGTFTINAQDDSKKLMDYFIAENYIIDYKTTITPWIQQFAAEAGVSVNIVSLEDSIISSNSSLGMTSAYEQIMQLVQYGGGYFYFDASGTMIIGKMNTSTGGSISVNDSVIQSLDLRRHDNMLRNRAVVWGTTNPDTQEWVFADLSRTTPWNYDANDKRAVVFSNSTIYDTSVAQDIARKILNTFATITFEKDLSLIGIYNISVGGKVTISMSEFRGYGIVTTLNVEVSEKGIITNTILDEKCPRLFAYWGDIDDYVYVGTTLAGVWRKPLGDINWEDYTTGLPSGDHITDLYVNERILSTVDSGGTAYYRTTAEDWVELVPSGVYTASGMEFVPPENLYAVATTINHLTNDIIVGYNYSGEVDQSFVVVYSGGTSTFGSSYQVYNSGENLVKDYNALIYDLDTNDLNNFLCVTGGEGSGLALRSGWHLDLGERNGISTQGRGLSGYETNWELPVLDAPNALPTDGGQVMMYYDLTGDYIDENNFYLAWAHLKGSNAFDVVTIVPGMDESAVYCTYNSGGYIAVERAIISSSAKGSYTSDTAISTASTSIFTPYSIYKVGTGFADIVNVFSVIIGYPGFTIRMISVNVATGVEISNSIIYETTTKNVKGTSDDVVVTSGRYLYMFCYQYNYSGTQTAYFVIVVDQENGTVYENRVYLGDIGTARIINPLSDVPSDYCGGDICPSTENGCIYSIILGARTGQYANRLVMLLGSATNGSCTDMEEHTLFYNPNPTYWDWGIFAFDAYTALTGHSGEVASYYYRCFLYLEKSNSTKQQWLVLGSFTSNDLSPTIHLYTGSPSADYPYANGKTFSRLDIFPVSSRITYHDFFLTGYNTPTTKRYKSTGFIEGYVNLPTLNTYLPDGNPYTFNPNYWRYLGMDDGAGDAIFAVADTGLTTRLSIMCVSPPSFSTITRFFKLNESYFSYPYQNYTKLSQNFIYGGSSLYAMQFNGNLLAYLPGGGYNILRQDNEEFTPIYTVPEPYKIELSRPSPTFIYNISESGDAAGLNMYESFTNEIDDFNTVTPTYLTYDARLVDFITMSGVTLASGDLNSEGDGRYALISSRDAIKGFPVSLSGDSITVAVLSGDITHIETSNNLDWQYIFASISSGDMPTFYQKDNINGMLFVDQYFPSGLGDITIIRLDDRI